MKYPIIYVPCLKVKGMALFPFILVSERKYIIDNQIILHETIHLKQQLELFIFPFYLIYIANFFINLILYKNSYLAYYHIIFEREAFTNDTDKLYLQKRKLWSFLKYIKLSVPL